MSPVPYYPNPDGHPLATMVATSCAEEDQYGPADDGGCALATAIITGVAAILDARTRQVTRDVRRLKRTLAASGATDTVLGVCIRPATFAGATSGTEIMPVTAPNLFLADPWECY